MEYRHDFCRYALSCEFTRRVPWMESLDYLKLAAPNSEGVFNLLDRFLYCCRFPVHLRYFMHFLFSEVHIKAFSVGFKRRIPIAV